MTGNERDMHGKRSGHTEKMRGIERKGREGNNGELRKGRGHDEEITGNDGT